MAIVLEFIDLIVPIETIRRKYPGGWEQCLRDHENLIGGRVWYDNYLLRDGAMNPSDIKYLVDQWSELGFEVQSSQDGKSVWKDVCVVESILVAGTTLPCDWITVDVNQRIAYLKGVSPEPIIGRKDFDV